MLRLFAVLLLTASNLSASELFDVKGAFDLDYIKDVHASNVSDCKDAGGLVLGDEQLIHHFDFNNDGAIDMSVYDEFVLGCATSRSMFQGTAGAVQYWFIDGQLIDYSYSRGWELLNREVPILLRYRHGRACDEAGYMPCVSASAIVDGQFID